MDFIQIHLSDGNSETRRRPVILLDPPGAENSTLYIYSKGTSISEHGKPSIPRSIFPTRPSQFCYFANQVVQRTFHSSLTKIAVLSHPFESEFSPSTSLTLACDQPVAWQNPLVLYMAALAEDLHRQTHDPASKSVVSGRESLYCLSHNALFFI